MVQHNKANNPHQCILLNGLASRKACDEHFRNNSAFTDWCPLLGYDSTLPNISIHLCVNTGYQFPPSPFSSISPFLTTPLTMVNGGRQCTEALKCPELWGGPCCERTESLGYTPSQRLFHDLILISLRIRGGYERQPPCSTKEDDFLAPLNTPVLGHSYPGCLNAPVTNCPPVHIRRVRPTCPTLLGTLSVLFLEVSNPGKYLSLRQINTSEGSTLGPVLCGPPSNANPDVVTHQIL